MYFSRLIVSVFHESKQAFAHVMSTKSPQPRAWAEEWLEADSRARVLVKKNLHVVWKNKAADSLFESGAGLSLRNGYLLAADRAVQDEIERLVVENRDGANWRILGKPGGASHVAVRSWRSNDAAAHGLIFHTLAHVPLSSIPDLPVEFGFTKAEQQIIKMLLAGRSSTQIASKLDNSVLTVRTHMKRVYSKLGINSREQLFASLTAYLILGLQ